MDRAVSRGAGICVWRTCCRGGRTDHCLHVIVDHVLGVHGLSLADIQSWGGGVFYDAGFPPNIKGVEAGERDAVFDEALGTWTPKAIELGMNFLRIEEPELRKLEAMGYKRATMDKTLCRGLTDDVPTLDFSGWPVYTSAATPDDVVARLCEAIEQCKDRIPWQSEGPLPLDRMCADTPEGPMMVPLHPAAERYWRAQGHLSV